MTDSETGKAVAVLQADMKHVCDAVERIDKKLDAFADTKADTSYVGAVDGRVTELRGWLWGLVIAVGLSLIGTLGALALALIRS
jgi:tetrahydromethanopterin S-methyltransferase subunit G